MEDFETHPHGQSQKPFLRVEPLNPMSFYSVPALSMVFWRVSTASSKQPKLGSGVIATSKLWSRWPTSLPAVF